MTTTSTDNPGRRSAADISMEKYVDSRLEAMNKAVEVAYAGLDKRLNGMNRASLLTREEFMEYKNQVEADIRSLMESRDVLKGKADQKSVNDTKLIAIIGIVLSIIGIGISLLK